MKKRYTKPEVLQHEPVVFETAISCNPPSEIIPNPFPGGEGKLICIHPDQTWDPYP